MIRLFDLFLSIIGVIIFLPLFLILCFVINLESRGGCIYKQIRVGRHNKDFYLYKFRSMFKDADKESLITIGNRDYRITRIGYLIRKYKLDELPQLFNVIKGNMSIVGPRPEVRKYVDLYNNDQLKVLQKRPGITDYASINFRNENEFLKNAIDPEKMYIDQIMSLKIHYNMIYINNYKLTEYFKIIFLTLIKIL